MAAGADAAKIVPEFGLGELSGPIDSSTSGVRYHGDPFEEYRFHVHPRRFDFLQRGMIRWRTERDTLLKPEEFCRNCEFARRFGHGEEVWRRRGHDCDGLGRASPEDALSISTELLWFQ